LSRRGRSLPATAGSLDTHRDPLTSCCTHQAALKGLAQIHLSNVSARAGSDASMPAGCSVVVQAPAFDPERDGRTPPTTASVYLNTHPGAASGSASACGGGGVRRTASY
jgi:hypothetical protein